jgi:hypothetical protein
MWVIQRPSPGPDPSITALIATLTTYLVLLAPRTTARQTCDVEMWINQMITDVEKVDGAKVCLEYNESL